MYWSLKICSPLTLILPLPLPSSSERTTTLVSQVLSTCYATLSLTRTFLWTVLSLLLSGSLWPMTTSFRHLGMEGAGACIRPLWGLVSSKFINIGLKRLPRRNKQNFPFCRAIDSGSYDWKKLDPKSEECKNLVTQYWKWEVIFTSNLNHDIN